ncbi:hypothetical protein [Kitasatospora sp. NPDC088783]|uniref:hypothetical protein n=1 Tax=Kitasatospora sp. NPDC088783 TaxID=3364077 RepID=UPI0037F64D33
MTGPSGTEGGCGHRHAAWEARLARTVADHQPQGAGFGNTADPVLAMLHPVAAETDLPDLQDGFALRDQLVRLATEVERADALASARDSEGARQVYEVEARHAVRELVEIVGRGGWPRSALVGNAGTAAALTIASHADRDQQVLLLPALRTTVRNGGAPETHQVRLEAMIAAALGASLDDLDLLLDTWATAGAAA